MFQWILENKEWLFSGIGVIAIGFLIRLIAKNASTSKQVQKAGKNSENYQAGRDINIK